MSPERDPLHRLGDIVARHNARWMDLHDVVERAERRWVRHRRQGFRRFLPALGSAAAVLVIGGVVALWLLAPPGKERGDVGEQPAVRYWVGEQPGQHGQWLTADGASGSPCRFADGTTVLAMPGTRLRVRADASSGTTVEVERGRIAASVRHRPGVVWRFEVGPVDIRVTGTRFDASWDPDRDLFDLVMHDGSVVVSGPAPGEKRSVIAGQQLRLHHRSDGTSGPPTQIAVTLPTPPLAPASAGGSRADAATGAATRPTAGVPVPPTEAFGGPVPDWRDPAARGFYREALARIEAVGFDRIRASSTAADLLQIGDVARLTGRPELAYRAYLTMRQRFFSDPSTAQAAFALGLLAFPWPAAAGWFETYLSEAPSGPLAREALGRLFEVHNRMGEPAAAREQAERYLRSYPDGPHAELARGILAPRR